MSRAGRAENPHFLEWLGVSRLFSRRLDDVEAVLGLDEVPETCPGFRLKGFFSKFRDRLGLE